MEEESVRLDFVIIKLSYLIFLLSVPLIAVSMDHYIAKLWHQTVKRDSCLNYSCGLLPVFHLGPILLSMSHLNEVSPLINATLNILSSLLEFLLNLPRQPLFPCKEVKSHFPHHVNLTPEHSHSSPLFNTATRSLSQAALTRPLWKLSYIILGSWSWLFSWERIT